MTSTLSAFGNLGLLHKSALSLSAASFVHSASSAGAGTARHCRGMQ